MSKEVSENYWNPVPGEELDGKAGLAQLREKKSRLSFLTRHCRWDAIEINPEFQSALRDKKAS